ncbi:MAG: hypothetical protein IPK63_18320 [Candidatus Competibacteraceae bacterium]|nr:hypothetical protein [Candidatus Competibacteraceae bacterium]
MNGPFHDIGLGGGNRSRKVAIGDRNRRAALSGSGGDGCGGTPAIMMVIVGLPELDADVLLAPVALNRMVWVVPAATATIFESMTLPLLMDFNLKRINVTSIIPSIPGIISVPILEVRNPHF